MFHSAARTRTLLVVCLAAACGCSTNPSQPSAGGGNAASTASVTVPRPASAAADAQIRNVDQPVPLVVGNAVVTKSTGVTYTFEVATDTGFANKVFSRSGVAEGSGGQTRLTIDKVGAGADYYWRARAEGGGTLGPFSAPRRFTIGPAVVLGAPVPVGPLTGAQTVDRPTFTVANVTRQGPAGAIVYRFEISTNSAFSPVAITASVAEGQGQTSFTPAGSLTPNQTHYWRATAIDQSNGVSSPASPVHSFTPSPPTPQSLLAAQLGVSLWPGVQPPGTNGHARMGANWDVQTLRSFDGVTFVSPPIEALRLFDLLDRGLDPDGAIAWMKSNGYPSTAAYYPSVQVIGIPYEYIALINGRWDLVLRAGA
jgi:hypothetical protein